MNLAAGASDSAQRPAWLRWLHRIGYVTTAMVLAGGLSLALSVLSRPWPPILFGQDATFDGTLEEAWREWNEYGGAAVLASLPDRKAIAPSGLRLVIMPSFSDWFGLALYAGSDGGAEGVLSRLQQPPWNRDHALPPIEIERRSFPIPAEDLGEFIRWFDAWAVEQGSRNYVPCLDGTSVAFERVEGSEVLSGRGNCELQYDLLRQQTLAFVKRHEPDAVKYLHPDWHQFER